MKAKIHLINFHLRALDMCWFGICSSDPYMHAYIVPVMAAQLRVFYLFLTYMMKFWPYCGRRPRMVCNMQDGSSPCRSCQTCMPRCPRASRQLECGCNICSISTCWKVFRTFITRRACRCSASSERYISWKTKILWANKKDKSWKDDSLHDKSVEAQW